MLVRNKTNKPEKYKKGYEFHSPYYTTNMNKYLTFCWPLKQRIINQKFGENRACIDNETNSVILTCDGNNPPLGFRSIYGPKGHSGLDLSASHGTEVYCAKGGIVDSIDTNPRTGLDVRVISVVGDRVFKHIYEHLLGYQSKAGDRIETGQLIGWADNTGYSSASHLHFELQELIGDVWIPVDPQLYLGDLYAKDALFYENTLKYLKEQVAMLSDRLADWLRKGRKT